MDKQQINEYLAVHLMGFTEYESPTVWKSEEYNTMVVSWNPCDNKEQAFMVVEKMWQGVHPNRLYLTTLFDGTFLAQFKDRMGQRTIGKSQGDTPAEAICRAAYEAIK